MIALVMATHYIVGCGAVVRNGRGEFLMVRQMSGYWRGLWIFPGGKLELGESLEHCARREFLEETGCDVAIKNEIGAYVSYDPDTEFEKQVVLVYFMGESANCKPIIGEGVTEVGWFDIVSIREMAAEGQVPEIILKVAIDSKH
jgi:ADP-ribose pyrophosphatase YjhB (NUDIX family)